MAAASRIAAAPVAHNRRLAVFFGSEPRRRIAPQSLVRFKAKVRELTRRTCGRSLAQIAKELSVYLTGWRGYFGFCQTPSVLRKLDEWLRRRLRAIAWKQWKHGRARFAELRRCGVGRDLAAQTARKPSWPMAAQQQPSALPLAAKRLLQITRPDFHRRAATCLIQRTAGYGPVSTVVCEGGAARFPPIPIAGLKPKCPPRESRDVEIALREDTLKLHDRLQAVRIGL